MVPVPKTSTKFPVWYTHTGISSSSSPSNLINFNFTYLSTQIFYRRHTIRTKKKCSAEKSLKKKRQSWSPEIVCSGSQKWFSYFDYSINQACLANERTSIKKEVKNVCKLLIATSSISIFVLQMFVGWAALFMLKSLNRCEIIKFHKCFSFHSYSWMCTRLAHWVRVSTWM